MKKLLIDKMVSDEQYCQIQELLNKNVGMWKPEPGKGGYWWIAGNGNVAKFNYDRDIDGSEEAIAIGNFYQTEAEAQAKVEWLKAVQRIKEYIAREFGRFEPDFINDEGSYIIFYNFIENIFDSHRYVGEKELSDIGYLRSAEDAEKLIKDMNKDLKIVFNVNN